MFLKQTRPHLALARLVVYGIAIMALTSCGPPERVGVRLSDDGESLVIVVARCKESARALRVSVSDRHEAKRISDLEIIWSIVSDSGSIQNVYMVGVLPTDFREETNFNRPLVNIERLGVDVEVTRNLGSAFSFARGGQAGVSSGGRDYSSEMPSRSTIVRGCIELPPISRARHDPNDALASALGRRPSS